MAIGVLAAPAPRHALAHRATLPLLALLIFINTADRGTLATAAPLIRDHLQLSSSQLGILLSAFYWTYAPSVWCSGWVIHRMGAYRALALGLAIWAAATVLTGLAGGFASLLALRLLLGVGESVTFPCMSVLLARHVPPERLGAANGLAMMGLGLGPAFGTFAGALLMARFGWRAVFLMFGIASFAWLIPWRQATRHAGAARETPAVSASPSYATLLKLPALWGTCLGMFCSNYAYYVVLSWLPLYLVKARGLSVSEMGTIGGLIYILFAASTLACGMISDRLIAAGFGLSRVRKTGLITAAGIVACSLVIAAYGGVTTSLVCMCVIGIFFGPGSANVFLIGQTIAGPHAAGKWIGIQNSVGNLAGVVAPALTGFVVQSTGEFYWAFLIASFVTIVGMGAWGFLVPEVRGLRWELGD